VTKFEGRNISLMVDPQNAYQLGVIELEARFEFWSHAYLADYLIISVHLPPKTCVHHQLLNSVLSSIEHAP
jgi:hypothetical protein